MIGKKHYIEQTLLAPGITLRRVSRCALILALLLLSASLWFFKASMLLSGDTPLRSNLPAASTSSPFSLSKTREEDEAYPLPIIPELTWKPSLVLSGPKASISMATAQRGAQESELGRETRKEKSTFGDKKTTLEGEG